MAYGKSTNSKKKKKKKPPQLTEGGLQDMLKIAPQDPRPIA
jgi:hypothetical protein